MTLGDKIWIWDSSGRVDSGIFIGEEGEWCKVDIGDYIKFKKCSDIFTDKERAYAWQYVKRVKRLLNQGVPIEDVTSVDDKEKYQLAIKLFPEELI